MKLNLTVARTSKKAEVLELDVPSLDHALLEIAKKQGGSLVTEKMVYNVDSTISIRGKLYFGNNVKDDVLITVKY